MNIPLPRDTYKVSLQKLWIEWAVKLKLNTYQNIEVGFLHFTVIFLTSMKLLFDFWPLIQQSLKRNLVKLNWHLLSMPVANKGSGGAAHHPKSAKRSTFSHKMDQNVFVFVFFFAGRLRGGGWDSKSQKGPLFGGPAPPQNQPWLRACL